MTEALEIEKPSGIFGIIVTETVVVLAVLLTVLTVKYFFKNCYADLKAWYDVYICADTDPDEVVEKDSSEQKDDTYEI